MRFWARSVLLLGAGFIFQVPSANAAVIDPGTLISVDIGTPSQPGTTEITNDLLRLTADGLGLGPRDDSFHFAETTLTNDFDLKVRVTSLDATDMLARAGFMVRESLEANAPFVGVFASPTAAGTHFLIRTSAGSIAQQTGFFPPNLPNAWLRLRRTNDVFTGFASYDGIQWSLLSSNTVHLTNALVGFAVTSRNPQQSTRAVFTDLADVGVNDSLVPFALEIEPPGPTSRRSAIVISEVMYHPADRTDGRNGEFVEIYNSQPYFEDISGWRVAGAYDFTFPTNTILPGGSFILVAPNPSDVTALSGVTNVVGGFTNALPNSSGTVRLLSERGAVFFDLTYQDKSPWPLAADGSGHSLALVRPSYGEADPRAWAASSRPGGSPGAWEFADTSPRHQVVFNEMLARSSGTGSAPFVELYNRSGREVDLAGCRLGYNEVTPAYVFPAGTRLAARGFLSLTDTQLGFALRADAETLFLRSPVLASDGGAVLDAVRFEPSSPGVSRGRSADGSAELYELFEVTPGLPNSPPLPAAIVFNEIMYNPLSGNKDLEFVEFYNAGSNSVNLAGWRIDGGVEFTFPSATLLAPGEYLVVAGNVARLRALHPNLTAANCLGNLKGNLSGRGERLVLERPEIIPDGGGGATRTVFAPADEVTYGTGGQWGQWADGGGSSLELTDPRANRRFAANWADSDESTKGGWTTIEATGVLDLGGGSADSLHVGLLGEGEALLDNLEVIGPGGTNSVINGDFEGAVNGFTVQGNHIRSGLETTGGEGDSRCLHLRASGNLDTGANRVRFRFIRPLTVGETYTLRARMRWLKGWPEPLLRVHGNWLEATGRLDVPENCGTPGAQNSGAVNNAGPALAEVSHRPVLPAVGEDVVISIRADDPDGLGEITLNWRADPATEPTAQPMRDDGRDGDIRAGDGVYSATIPGQNAGTMVAFWIQAADAAAPSAVRVFPAGAPARECLVRFGEVAAGNAFGTYRIWLTRKNTGTWSSRPNLSNEPVDGTLVYGNFRAIHGAGYRFAGSPYHQQFSSPTSDSHYVWRLPADDRLLGSDNFNKIHAPGNGPFDDETTQREQTVYWMARQLGLPWLYRRYVNVYVNGSKRRRLMEDTQVPSGDFVSSYYPDDDQGDLYKINPWFEFQSETGQSLQFNNMAWADLNDYRTTGNVRKLGRYRWNWQPRAADGTVNDYGRFFDLVDTANAPSEDEFIRGMDSETDLEQWLRTFALNHAVGNWDSYGNRNAQNMYAYRPERGPWQLIMWDANIVFGNSGSDGPSGDDLFQYNGSDGPMGRIYNTPKFRRAYFQYLREITTGPMEPNRLATLLDAKYTAFQAAGVTASTPTSIKSWIRSRVSYINSQVNRITASFSAQAVGVTAGTTPINLISLSGTAPLTVRTLRINGMEPPITWTSETAWTVRVVLNPGTNTIILEGLDARGQLLAGTTRQFTVRFTGAPELPSEKLVFSEIHYHPTQPGAEFVELLNASVANAFDLSGWRVDGLGYTFPAGTVLEAGQRWVLAASRGGFNNSFDPTRARADAVFPGTLSPEGETLRLIKPGPAPDLEELVTGVTYSAQTPWPAGAAGGGSSLQLIDPVRSEDERVGNWAVVAPRDPNLVTWKRAQATGIAGSNATVQLYLSSFPPVSDLLDVVGSYWGTITFGGNPVPYGVRFARDAGTLGADFLFDATDPSQFAPMIGVSQNGFDVRFGFDGDNRFVGKLAADGSRITGSYLNPGATAPFSFLRVNPGGELILDDVSLVVGTVPEAGPNLVSNGDFESPITGPWQSTGEHSPSELTSVHSHSGTSALNLRSQRGGTGSDSNAVTQTVTGLTAGEPVTLSFWYLGSTNGSGFMARLGDGAVEVPVKLDPPKDPHDEYTPGYANTSLASLPAFPEVWLNEVLPDPLVGTPWAELVNQDTNSLNLGGLFLSDSIAQLTRDAFPAGLSLNPGQFLLVALDGTGTLNNPADLRASFRPTATNGALYLTRVKDGHTNLVDFIRWQNLFPGRSVGHFPDASPHDDREFAMPTPGASNSLVVPTQPVVINEWLALNSTIADPAGDPTNPEFDDWFELYNPNATPVNLAGYILSNSPTDSTKFRIPTGYIIPARGYLLVWADNQSRQNAPNQADLHVNFKLSGDGEAIALFTPDGALVDSVIFGRQESNVSEGRSTDGGTGAFVRFSNPSPRTSNSPRPPPVIPVVGVPYFDSLGRLVLVWSAEVGRSYQVLWKDQLFEPWKALGAPQTAGGPQLSVSDLTPSPQGRFYQVQVAE